MIIHQYFKNLQKNDSLFIGSNKQYKVTQQLSQTIFNDLFTRNHIKYNLR